jgi:hypothetical protein
MSASHRFFRTGLTGDRPRFQIAQRIEHRGHLRRPLLASASLTGLGVLFDRRCVCFDQRGRDSRPSENPGYRQLSKPGMARLCDGADLLDASSTGAVVFRVKSNVLRIGRRNSRSSVTFPSACHCRGISDNATVVLMAVGQRILLDISPEEVVQSDGRHVGVLRASSIWRRCSFTAISRILLVVSAD